jgi:hypothetical protein
MAILKLERVQSTFFLGGWWMPQMQCPPHLGVIGHSYLEYHEFTRGQWQQFLLVFCLSHIQKTFIAPCTNSELKHHQQDCR